MTTQEAIKFGEMYLEMNEDSKDSDTYQFIEAAIKALKQKKNCELTAWGECSYNETGCSECAIKVKITKALSTQAIKDCSNCKHGEYNDHLRVYICDFANECHNIDKWESAEYKVGEWVAYGDIPKECPFCGEDWDKYVFGDVWHTGELPKFCPNCGADMRGEQNE